MTTEQVAARINPWEVAQRQFDLAADKVRTRRQARVRLIELLTARPIERLAVLHASAPDVEAFADELAVSAGISGGAVSVHLIGPAVGSHVGPGAYGAAVLYRSGTVA